MAMSSILEKAQPFGSILFAAFFVFIALKVLLGRRPFLFSLRWFFACCLILFLPDIARLVDLGLSSPQGIGSDTWIGLACCFGFLIFGWIKMKGYVALGISGSYFREALLASSSALGYSVEETMSRIRIKATGQEIQVAIQDSVGSAHIKPTDKASNEVVKQIVNGMICYFQKTSGKKNYLSSYVFLVLGILSIVNALHWLFVLKTV
jgi:hypothetical protein